jgi:hypothetical protein
VQDMASSAEKVKTPQGELRAIGFGQVGEHGKGIQLFKRCESANHWNVRLMTLSLLSSTANVSSCATVEKRERLGLFPLAALTPLKWRHGASICS